MSNRNIPASIRRLPQYYWIVKKLRHECEDYISSARIAQELGISAARVRSDLHQQNIYAENCVGYEPAYLLSALRHVLGIDCCLSAVLLGATGLGRLLLDGNCLCECGMRLAAVFDRLPLADDKEVQGMEIQDFAVLPAFLDQFPVDISIIASPSFANNQTCEMLSQYGVKAALDITDTSFVCAASSSLMVDKFSLAESLLSLSGMLNQKRAGVFSSTTPA